MACEVVEVTNEQEPVGDVKGKPESAAETDQSVDKTLEESVAEDAAETAGDAGEAPEAAGDSGAADMGEEETAQTEASEADVPDGEAETASSTDSSVAAGKSEKKKAAKKKAKKDKRDEKIAELNDRLMRNLAEFENFRNRSEKEKTAMFEIGAKSVIEKMLPVVDNLERGFDGLSEEDRESPFVKGIEAVYKQLQTAFEEMGVVPIEAVGKEFDPNLHNAVMHDEDDSGESNLVVEEFQKGYLYKDSVVRHSMVKVLN